MTELLVFLTPILVVDFVNPILLGLLVFAAASSRPVANSSMMLIGHTITYFVAGVGIAHGLEQITDRLVAYWNNPPTLAFGLSIILGIVCFYWALRPPQAKATQDKPNWQLTPTRCFGYGVLTGALGVPFAVPYIAAIDQILKADLDAAASMAVLVVYNIAYALPFLVVPVTVLLRGDQARPFLQRFSDWVVTFVAKLMPWLIGLLGTWLLFDGIYFFVVGEPVI